MKAHILAIVLFSRLLSNNISAQSCSGASGPNICTPQSGLTKAGFYPAESSLPCATDGAAYKQVISLFIPNTLDGYTVESMQLNSVSNLPCGLCWASNSTTNTIAGGTAGCINVSGTTSDAPGQFRLIAYSTFTVSVPIIGNVIIGPIRLDSLLGIDYNIRVHQPNVNCLPVDTSAGFTGNTTGNPAAITASGPTTFCQGDSVTLTATTGSVYQWSTGQSTQTIHVTTSGTYVLTVTNDNDCSGTASIVVTVHPTSSVLLSAAICKGSTYNFNGHILSITGVYTDTLLSTSGCDSIMTLELTVEPLPGATITASGPTTFCKGGSLTLTAKAGTGYKFKWSTGATTASIKVDTSGSFVYVVTNSKGCTDTSATKKITVDALPKAKITVSDNTVCSGGTAKLTVSKQTGGTYNWSTGATSQAITVSASGTYKVTVTNANDCTASGSDDLSCSAAVDVSNKTGANEDDANTDAIPTSSANGHFNISVYPNPYTGQFHLNVTSTGNESLHVKIYDVNGRLLEDRNDITNGSDAILGNGYAAGVYVVQVQQGNISKEVKVVKAE